MKLTRPDWQERYLCGSPQLQRVVAAAKAAGKRVVTTNGCFDLLHQGHIHLLQEAASRLGFMHVDVHALQAEEVIPNADPWVDLVTARAVAPLERLLPRLGRPSLPIKRLLVMVSPRAAEEFAGFDFAQRGPWKLIEARSYRLNGERGERSTLLLGRKKQK